MEVIWEKKGNGVYLLKNEGFLKMEMTLKMAMALKKNEGHLRRKMASKWRRELGNLLMWKFYGAHELCESEFLMIFSLRNSIMSKEGLWGNIGSGEVCCRFSIICAQNVV